MDLKLAGKRVLITGGSKGIGRASAEVLADEGCDLILVARDPATLDAAAAGIRARRQVNVRMIPADLSSDAAVRKVAAEAGEIDILVNNAGLSRGLDKLYTGKIEDWDEMIDTNVKGLLYVTRAVVPGMVKRGTGHIVNLGSTAGELTYPNGAVYCATKAAEKSINDGLRQDLLGTPLRVTSIDPGMVETDFSKVRFRGDDARAAKVYQGVIPLTPDDVADAIVWAASRPAHVNIAHVLMTSVSQANSLMFHREAAGTTGNSR